MSRRREQPFRCDFEATSLHVFAHVCAWDAPEAVGLFEAELREDGVTLPGQIEVKPLGRPSRVTTARFRPRAAARGRPAMAP